MSEKKDQEYFADGMAEEILNILAKVPSLKVIGRTSSFQFNPSARSSRTTIGGTIADSVLRKVPHKRLFSELLGQGTLAEVRFIQRFQ
jgi:hypothetical protein